jgi:hypothetical protein
MTFHREDYLRAHRRRKHQLEISMGVMRALFPLENPRIGRVAPAPVPDLFPHVPVEDIGMQHHEVEADEEEEEEDELVVPGERSDSVEEVSVGQGEYAPEVEEISEAEEEVERQVNFEELVARNQSPYTYCPVLKGGPEDRQPPPLICDVPVLGTFSSGAGGESTRAGGRRRMSESLTVDASGEGPRSAKLPRKEEDLGTDEESLFVTPPGTPVQLPHEVPSPHAGPSSSTRSESPDTRDMGTQVQEDAPPYMYPGAAGVHTRRMDMKDADIRMMELPAGEVIP